MTERSRATLAAPSATLTGIGLHSGRETSLRLLPAPSGSGLIFRDMGSGQEIPARAANVTDTSRCTRLSAGGVEVQTVEHVLSALAGLGVDDILIETFRRRGSCGRRQRPALCGFDSRGWFVRVGNNGQCHDVPAA